MSSETTKSLLFTILGITTILFSFYQFFQNSVIGASEFVEILIGIGLSIYFFKMSNGQKKNGNSELLESKKSLEITDNNFKSESDFSGSLRLFATFLDFTILSVLFGFSFDYLSFFISEGWSMIICFIVIYVILYSFIQFKNFGSLYLISKKRIVKNDGSDLTFNNFLQRTIAKILVVFGYTFLISFILFPPLTYFDRGLTPVDNVFGTVEKSNDRKSNNSNNRSFQLIIDRFRNKLLSLSMKKYISENNKSKLIAFYLAWFFLHFFFYIFSGKRTINSFGEVVINLSGEYQYTTNEDLFFPLDRCNGELLNGVYDYSEFLLYTLVPVIIYFVIKLFRNQAKVD
jgi:hypothetical protein